MTHAVNYDSLRVACLEHLLVLKLEAYSDRKASSKGQKDAKDIIRIGLCSYAQKKKFSASLCLAYLSNSHLALLQKIRKGPDFLSLAKGNAKFAKTMRDKFEKATLCFF
jgi:hypothetical protein